MAMPVDYIVEGPSGGGRGSAVAMSMAIALPCRKARLKSIDETPTYVARVAAIPLAGAVCLAPRVHAGWPEGG